VSSAEERLLLVSPFIKKSRTNEILSQLERRGAQSYVQVVVLTDLRPESALNGSTDLEALVDLGSRLQKVELTHLPSLHAKVYVADRNMAIITSGNLTDSGLSGNIEYGIVLTNRVVVSEIRRDFERYARLGAIISPMEIKALLDDLRELKLLFRRAQQTVRGKTHRAFRQKLRATHVQLLRHRAKGKTTNAILSETILFLLAKGPLRTRELHPLIQRLHPDICDDSFELVIDGVHFGKKWKHHVRNAQQFLKREGRIRYDGSYWLLVS
jgi:hypothetical protein